MLKSLVEDPVTLTYKNLETGATGTFPINFKTDSFASLQKKFNKLCGGCGSLQSLKEANIFQYARNKEESEEEHEEESENEKVENAEEEANRDSPPACHTIRVRDQGGDEIFFKVKTTTLFSKLFDAYAKRQGIARTSLCFLFEGENIEPADTFQSLKLEDNCVFDVVVQGDEGAIERVEP